MTSMPFRTLALALAAALLLGACGSKQDRIETGLVRSADYMKSGELDKAGVELRNVLQIDPKNARAHLISAQIADAQGDPRRAYGLYAKAVELDGTLLDARVGVARLHMMAGDTDKARSLIAEVLAQDARHAGGRTIAAALKARAGQVAEAEAEAKAVIAEARSVPVDATMVLAGLYSNQNRPAEAIAAIERALQAEPRHLGLLQVAAMISAQAPKGDPLAGKADTFFENATAEQPKNHDLWRSWAQFHVGKRDLDRAEAVLRKAVEAFPSESRRTQDLLAFLASARGFSVAEKAYQQAIADKPRDMALRFGLASLYRQANRVPQAQAVLREIAQRAEDPASELGAKGQLAGYALATGRHDEARTLVEEVLKANPRDNTALLLRGRLALRDGRAVDAVADLRAVVRDQPGSVEAVGLLAQAHRRAKEPQLAREVLADAVKLAPADPDLRLLLVADLADAGDFRNAQAELDAGLRADPKVVRLHEAKARLALMQKDTAGAERALQALKAALPKDAGGPMRLAALYAQQGRLDKALQEYDAAAVLAPADPAPTLSAVGTLIAAGKLDEASRRTEARLQREPGRAVYLHLRGDVAAARRDYAAAEAAYVAAMKAAPKVALGYINVARARVSRQDIPGALAVLAEGERALPDELDLPMMRAEWLTRWKRHDEALALYEQLRQRAPEHDGIANNYAFLVAQTRSDRASLERALQAAERFAGSSDPRFLDSLGWVHYKLGQTDRALPLLQKAVAMAPNSPMINLHVGKALVKSGQADKGREHLKKALDSKADLPDLDQARAMLAAG